MKVQLLTSTKKMAENLWLIWQLSRSTESIEQILTHYNIEEVKEFFARIINEDIPLSEMVDFVFLLEDIPISLREQLVRHRIGVKVGGHDYVDSISDLADSSFWSQSMRVMDMSDFKYFIPESIGEQIPTVVTGRHKIPAAVYNEAMQNAARAYRQLVEEGIPREDARNVIPLGATHRIVWKLNLSAIKHIVSKRSCWILQLGLWKPVLHGMIDELAQDAPVFRQLVTPPCMRGNEFLGCKFCENNKARIVGDVDCLPPCPLFLHHHWDEAKNTCKLAETAWWSHIGAWNAKSKADEELMNRMRIEYCKFWYRNVDTGEMLTDG